MLVFLWLCTLHFTILSGVLIKFFQIHEDCFLIFFLIAHISNLIFLFFIQIFQVCWFYILTTLPSELVVAWSRSWLSPLSSYSWISCCCCCLVSCFRFLFGQNVSVGVLWDLSWIHSYSSIFILLPSFAPMAPSTQELFKLILFLICLRRHKCKFKLYMREAMWTQVLREAFSFYLVLRLEQCFLDVFFWQVVLLLPIICCAPLEWWYWLPFLHDCYALLSAEMSPTHFLRSLVSEIWVHVPWGHTQLRVPETSRDSIPSAQGRHSPDGLLLQVVLWTNSPGAGFQPTPAKTWHKKERSLCACKLLVTAVKASKSWLMHSFSRRVCIAYSLTDGVALQGSWHLTRASIPFLHLIWIQDLVSPNKN